MLHLARQQLSQQLLLRARARARSVTPLRLRSACSKATIKAESDANGKDDYRRAAHAPNESQEPEPTTHFGFKQVPLAEKQTLVSSVFSSVANNYDLMNDVMSLRVHRLWKSAFVNDMGPTGNMRILDCAGGTGDIALRVADYVHQSNGWLDEHSGITVCDINEHMLSQGEKRASAIPDSSRIHFALADAQHLPFDDCSFDVYCISFGMRNVPQPHLALREALRVLKPGGRFMMLEFGKVQVDPVRRLYDAWSFGVIPTIGRVIAQDEPAYRYLIESIRRFPAQPQFLRMMSDAGFVAETATDYSFGIATCYSAFKI